MKTYLVTGGCGFIGTNFIQYLLKNYDDIKIINLDKLTYAGNLENHKEYENDKRLIFVKGDIADSKIVDQIFCQYEIDYVVNFAAESHVDRSIIEPEIFVRTNVLGTATLLNVARRYWEHDDSFLEGKKFIQISTDEVYGSLGPKGYFTETTPLDPHSPYSASKASADLLVKSYYDTYKMPVITTRCSNNYGPYQFPEKLIPLVITNCLNKKPIPVYGDGLHIRDWIYVEDHCRAIDLVIKKGRLGEVYNIGANNEQKNISIVKMIIHYLNKNYDSSVTEGLITYVADRKGHDRRYAIDSRKIKKELGWEPTIKFEDGLGITIKWYLENSEFLEKYHVIAERNVINKLYQKY